jgi:predicted methyltransferase
MESPIKNLSLAVSLALALTACGPATEHAPAPESASDQPAEIVAPKPADAPAAMTLDSAIAGDWRSADNKARDGARHPKETLEFFGVQPGQTVVEITPGGGWYTEILAPLLRGNGHYVAAIASAASSEYNARGNAKFREKLGADASHFDAARSSTSIRKHRASAPKVRLTADFRNVHNCWQRHDGGNVQGFNAVLKPGGTLGVVDHRAADSTDPASLEKSAT